jgi:sirohydrochlorin ferrochelatase
MHEFARLRTVQTPVGATEGAFLAMAQPAVSDVLPLLGAQNWRRIVVQPHLLFQGLLLEELAAAVRTMAARHPHQEWVVVPHLAAGIGGAGPADELLVSLVLQRFQAAAIRVVGSGKGG